MDLLEKAGAKWTGTQLIIESQICTIAFLLKMYTFSLIKPVVALEDVEG